MIPLMLLALFVWALLAGHPIWAAVAFVAAVVLTLLALAAD